MKLKFKVEATVRVETKGDDVDVGEFKDLVKDYMARNKFQLNKITMVADYTGELEKIEGGEEK